MKTIQIHGSTYDVTEFLESHPGGKQVLEPYIGHDATDAFLMMHPGNLAMAALKNLPVVDSSWGKSHLSDIQWDFRKLICDLKTLMRDPRQKIVNWIFLVTKLMHDFAIYASACACMATGRKWSGLLLLTYAHFTLKITSHYVIHRQITTNPLFMLRNLIALLVGASGKWWHLKHNIRHHSFANTIGHDTDIDIIPFIVLDPRQVLQSPLPQWSKVFIRYQHILVWPLLAFVRIWWIPLMYMNASWTERVLMTIHYIATAWIFTHVFGSVKLAMLAWVAMMMAVGFSLGIIFITNHIGNPCLTFDESKNMSVWEQVLLTTNNVTPGPFNDYISGYLDMQIEHHMFPWCPPTLIHVARDHVRKICKKHKLLYTEAGWWQSFKTIHKRLKDISESVLC